MTAQPIPVVEWRAAHNSVCREVNFGLGWVHPADEVARTWFDANVERLYVNAEAGVVEHQGCGCRLGVIEPMPWMSPYPQGGDHVQLDDDDVVFRLQEELSP